MEGPPSISAKQYGSACLIKHEHMPSWASTWFRGSKLSILAGLLLASRRHWLSVSHPKALGAIDKSLTYRIRHMLHQWGIFKANGRAYESLEEGASEHWLPFTDRSWIARHDSGLDFVKTKGS